MNSMLIYFVSTRERLSVKHLLQVILVKAGISDKSMIIRVNLNNIRLDLHRQENVAAKYKAMMMTTSF